MTQDLELECTCGAVHGKVRDVSAATVNRVVCICSDCQTFAHHLGRGDLLDKNGGSDIIQVAPDTVTYDRGTDKIAAVRLGPKGPYRFYTTCCKTPLGNTVDPARLPFIGFVYEIFKDAREPARRDAVFGPAVAKVYGDHAVGEPPPGSTTKMLLRPRFLLRTLGLLFGWKLRGRGFPNPYFKKGSATPQYPVRILSRDERQEARRQAGPRPA